MLCFRASVAVRFYLLCSALLLIISNIFALEQLSQSSTMLAADSTQQTAEKDSLLLSLIKGYHSFKLKEPLRLPRINWLKSDFSLNLKHNVYKVTDTELYQISKDLYTRYYKSRIELYNYRNTAFLNLNLKEAQKNQGALQFQISLPNFNTWARKRKHEEK